MILKTVITKTEYDVWQVATGFLTYNESYRRIRPSDTKCGGCGKSFTDGERLNLAQVRKKPNMCICDQCVNKLRSESADTTFIEREGAGE